MFPWTRTRTNPSDPQTGAGPIQPTVPQPAPEPQTSEVEAAPPARRFTDTVPPCETRLGRLRVRGTLSGSDSVELGGTFEGPIAVEGLCHVHEGGRVTGDITAGDAVIAGEVEGRLHVRGRLEMLAHARVLADVEATTIAIAEGCFMEGRIRMVGSKGAGQPTSFKEKRRGKRRAAHAPTKQGS